MTLPVIWSPSALREVAKIFDYLAAFNPQAAARVFDTLDRSWRQPCGLSASGKSVTKI
jgi:plasmid stabilization system protein ParE